MNVPPIVLGILITGWVLMLCLVPLWRHAERWKEKNYDDWKEEMNARSEAEVRAMQAIDQRDDALERIARFPKLWQCPSCGFEMNACHTEDEPGPEFYVCPSCFQSRVEPIVRRIVRMVGRDFKPCAVKPLLRAALKTPKYPKDAA